MKTFTSIILVIVFFNVYAQDISKINIAYSINLKENSQNDYYKFKITNINEQITNAQKQELFNAFLNKIKQEKSVTSYGVPNNANGIEFNKTDKNIFELNGEYVLDIPEGKITTKNGTIFLDGKKLVSFNTDNFLDELSSITFFETWNFDAEKGSFTKEVKQMGLTINDGKTNLFAFKTNPYIKNVYKSSTNNSYTLTGKNVFLGKISYYVDLTNIIKHEYHDRKVVNPENNTYLNNIYTWKRDKLYKNIFKYIKNEYINNHNTIVYDNNKALNYNEIINKFIQVDTVMYEAETGEVFWEIVQSIYNIDDITGINFTETWYLDINTFSIKKVVNSINLVLRYERQEEVEGFGYAYKKYFTIQLKNPVQGQNNFFFNKNAFLITENLYSLNNFIYKNNGEKFLPDTFAYIDNNFSNNVLIVGKKFIEINNYLG